jgi:hypothetical protein
MRQSITYAPFQCRCTMLSLMLVPTYHTRRHAGRQANNTQAIRDGQIADEHFTNLGACRPYRQASRQAGAYQQVQDGQIESRYTPHECSCLPTHTSEWAGNYQQFRTGSTSEYIRENSKEPPNTVLQFCSSGRG